ncbi:hypothetical protein [Pontibacter fetidus]|uniref:PE-PGRS family protein n=1 Tax=Pontibacter fetidus TaxID=2700082 RepID=A0A6B2H5T7_9BACT|nr:hypothetical protein [Pontibacter fetidus]NDK55667.1 hypothetical protein [Pontibacter fetidus]
MVRLAKFAAICLVVGLVSCKSNEAPAPEVIPDFVQVPIVESVTRQLTEVSGIADSKRNPGNLWVHEDGGNPAQLYLLQHNGATVKTVFLKGAANRDWEDMVLADNDLYIADIGDNEGRHEHNTIYKFPEPSATTDTVYSYEKIDFKYPDGAHDAEAFLVDPQSKAIFIITKRDNSSRIYKLNYPYTRAGILTAELVGNLPYKGVVSAALAANGKGIIIKTYNSLFYYSRTPNQSIDKTLRGNYSILPYNLEPQGEAVTFSVDAKGYYTLSEKAYKDEVNLNFYKMH